MDPMTILALAQGAKTLFSKKAKQPVYEPQRFGQQFGQQFDQQYEGQSFDGQYQAPSYEQDAQGTESGNALFQTIIGNQLANYNAGKPILGAGYRDAVLGQAKRSFDLSANESGNQVNEQYNKLNLLGATGHGQALGEVQRSRLQGLGDIEDRLTQAELGQLNNATQQGLSLQNAFQQRGNDAFRNRLAGEQARFGAGLQGYEANQRERQGAFNNRLQGYNANLRGYEANQRENQFAFGSRQQGAQNEQNLGMGLLQLGAGAYGNEQGRRNNRRLAQSLSGAGPSAWSSYQRMVK